MHVIGKENTVSKRNRNKHIKIIELLSKANHTAIRLVKEGRIQECLFLLAECQDSVVALGGHIEKLYGLGTKTVSVLESYCEALYQFSVALNEGAQIEEAIACLKEVTQAIGDTYNAEFPDKKEVVFLPYNASMWDSLESVWMAARDDKDCEAYVVPIPYYDLDANRCFKEFHYEGDLYPEYVPITHYEDYDLELHHPDMIFIHNPYDECNLVTSVAPEFYSSRIKDFTEKLVYIPYYILPASPLEKDQGFVLTKGVMNADYVFVQNEEVRQFYLKTIQNNIKDVDMNLWCSKIVGIGSPKTDKIINAKRDSLSVPENWKKIIGNKKVIFFNTNVSMILNNTDNIIMNLERILGVFKAHSEFAVIWREHPLTMATLDSMRPKIKQAYLELREQYIKEGWGILDETFDPHLAMTLADCYFGAGGSLSAVFPVSGKPIMIMDYLYPKRISMKEITISELLEQDSLRMLYRERNINSLELFLENMSEIEIRNEERKARQSIRMNNLDGTVGDKIFDYVKELL